MSKGPFSTKRQLPEARALWDDERRTLTGEIRRRSQLLHQVVLQDRAERREGIPSDPMRKFAEECKLAGYLQRLRVAVAWAMRVAANEDEYYRWLESRQDPGVT